MDNDIEIFEGKTFSSLARDIYHNSSKKADQISQLIKDLRSMVNDAGSATVIAPMIKDYLDVSIKNDEQLIKLSAVLQRYINAVTGPDGTSEFGLSDAEKEELLKNVSGELAELEETKDTIGKQLDNLGSKDEETPNGPHPS